MGTWVAIAIGLFVLGSIMALKPSGVDVRLDKLRMTARRLELNPKLVACPDWIRGRNNEYGKGMMGQYALILDDMKFPETRYQVIDGELRPDSTSGTQIEVNDGAQGNAGTQDVTYRLDHEPLNLPASITPFVKAVYTKANSLVVFWEDSGYVKPNTNPNYDPQHIEPDLLALKAAMYQWAQKLANKG